MSDGRKELAPEAVHLWLAPLDRPCDVALLTAEEQSRAERFKIEQVRQQFVASRVQLRIVLANYLGLKPVEVPILYEASGKPVLHESCGRGLHFNVSHSDRLAIYAVTRAGQVGVDVELQRDLPNAEMLVERFFSLRDRQIFQSLPEGERRAAFFRAWTRKEAVLKAVGKGVQSLDYCEVTFAPGEPDAVLRMGDDAECRAKWLLHGWQPKGDYVAAVAVELK